MGNGECRSGTGLCTRARACADVGACVRVCERVCTRARARWWGRAGERFNVRALAHASACVCLCGGAGRTDRINSHAGSKAIPGLAAKPPEGPYPWIWPDYDCTLYRSKIGAKEYWYYLFALVIKFEHPDSTAR